MKHDKTKNQISCLNRDILVLSHLEILNKNLSDVLQSHTAFYNTHCTGLIMLSSASATLMDQLVVVHQKEMMLCNKLRKKIHHNNLHADFTSDPSH